jgi:hypothetical protein
MKIWTVIFWVIPRQAVFWLYANDLEEHTASFFSAECGGIMLLQNFGIQPKYCTVQQPKGNHL